MLNRQAVLARLDQVFGGKTASGLSEGELLSRFATTGDEAAFTALVTRHGPMVLGVCRRVLSNVHDVEDAFQATFLVLARRAGAIRERNLLAPWLHGVAHRVAVRARAKGASRNARELALEFAPELEDFSQASPSGTLIAKELRGLLDDELARLPDSLRKPIILCYLEGLTHDEAAKKLRWPVGTVRSRMARARSLLRVRLAKQGHSALGMAGVGQLTREIVPRTLADATIRASLGFTTGKIPASAAALALAKGVIGLMVLQKAVIVGVLVVLAGTVSVAGAYGYQSGGFSGPSVSADQPEARDAPKPQEPEKEAQLPDESATKKIEQLTAALERSKDKLKELQAEIDSLTSQLDAIRPNAPKPANPPTELGSMNRMMNIMGGRPKGVDQRENAAGPMMTAMMGGGGAATRKGTDKRDPSRPQRNEGYLEFVRKGSSLCVVSPEGNRVTAYDLGAHRSNVIEFESGVKAIPRGVGSITAIEYRSKNPEFGSVPTVKTLAVFDTDRPQLGGKPKQPLAWNTKDLAVPYKGDVYPQQMSRGVFYEIGNTIYAYSQPQGNWSVLTLPDGPIERRGVNGELLLYQAEGHLHVYNADQGQWFDIDSRGENEDDKPSPTKTP